MLQNDSITLKDKVENETTVSKPIPGVSLKYEGVN